MKFLIFNLFCYKAITKEFSLKKMDKFYSLRQTIRSKLTYKQKKMKIFALSIKYQIKCSKHQQYKKLKYNK